MFEYVIICIKLKINYLISITMFIAVYSQHFYLIMYNKKSQPLYNTTGT